MNGQYSVKFDEYVSNLTRRGIFLFSLVLASLFICVVLIAVNIGAKNYGDYTFTRNSQNIWSENKEKHSEDNDSRFDLLFHPVIAGENLNSVDQRFIPLDFRFSINEISPVDKLEIKLTDTHTDNKFHTNFIQFDMDLDEGYWYADSGNILRNHPVYIKNTFFYPFEEITLNWNLNFNHLPNLEEISIYNRTGNFRFINLENDDEYVTSNTKNIGIKFKLVRPIFEIFVFASVIALGLLHIFLIIFILKNKYMFLLSWVAVLLFYLGYRTYMIPNLFSRFIFTDALFLAITYLSMVLSLFLIPKIASPSYSVFISYRYDDSEFAAGKIQNYLESLMPRSLLLPSRVFHDKKEIELGDVINDRIADAIGSCSVLILIIGRQWLTMQDSNGVRKIDRETDYSRIELEEAIKQNKTIIPVLVENSEVPTLKQLPESLAELSRTSGIPVRAFGEEFSNDMRIIYNRLQRLEP